jgi:glutathione S-transferase
VIVMRAKGVEFDVTYINLREKPDWFLKISPHGKVPVLKVGDTPLFESNAIAEFIEETVDPPLHPQDAIKRARNRAWTDYVPTFSSGLSATYYSTSKEAYEAGFDKAREVLAKLEGAIASERGNDGPYFNGPDLCLVDAAYAPFFQRFMKVEEKVRTSLLDEFPLVKAWCEALLSTEMVTGSVHETFDQEFAANMHRRGTVVADHFAVAAE